MRFGRQTIAASNLLLVFAMVAFIAVPLAGAMWRSTRPLQSNVEKRQLAGLPAWPASLRAWTRFPKAFDAYAHDRFGFRRDLLDGYQWLMASLFRQSTSDRAFVGSNGWLYFAGDGALADIQGTSPYTDAELRNAVEQINARGELLAVRGVRYGFVVFPDKHTVYPQFLPHGVYGGFDRRRVNALDAAMAQTGHAYYFDASNALRRAAGNSPFQLYYKSDTHWNPWGAYLGYRAWADASGKRLGLRSFDYSFDQFRLPHRSASGDLSKMSGLHPHDPDIYPPSHAGCDNSKAWHVPDEMLHRLGTIASHLLTAECGGGGTALILHDSFMDSIERYVASNFGKSWLVWRYVDDANFGWLVGRLHPDTVLVERVERLMGSLPKPDLASLVHTLGVIGEPVRVDVVSGLAIGDGNRNRKVLAREPVAGALERAVRDGNQVHIEGWVRMGDVPPAAVIAVLDSKVVGEAPVTLYRADVAASQHDSKLMWSGFRMDLPAGALAKDVRALHWYAVDRRSYGEFPMSPEDRLRLKGTTDRAP